MIFSSCVIVTILTLNLIRFSQANCEVLRETFDCPYFNPSTFYYDDVDYGVDLECPKGGDYYIECNNMSSQVLKPFDTADAKYIKFLHSNISYVPTLMFDAVKWIEIIYLNASNVSNIGPGAFEGLDKLNELHLQNNTISRLWKGDFSSIKALRTLDVSYNNIIVVEESALSELPDLRTFNISGNRIKFVRTEMFKTNENLVTLDCGHNIINSVDNDSFSTLSQLENLHLENNQIDTLHVDIFSALSSIILLDLSWNQLTSLNFLEKVSPNIRQVKLRGNKINFLNKTAFEDFNIILTLDLGCNEISVVEQNIFLNKPLLLELCLDDNAIQKLPIGLFQDNIALLLLNMSKNELTTLDPGSFTGLRHLEVLDLSYNKIKILPPHLFHDLEELRKLNISNNMITYFSIDRIMPLLLISLDNNAWNCTTLSKLVSVSEYAIVRGNTFKTSNIIGIKCKDDANDTTSIESFIESNLLDNVFHNTSLMNYFEEGYKNSSLFRFLSTEFKSKNVSQQPCEITQRIVQTSKTSNDSLKPFFISLVIALTFFIIVTVVLYRYAVYWKSMAIRNRNDLLSNAI